jgi:hypothetical protein
MLEVYHYRYNLNETNTHAQEISLDLCVKSDVFHSKTAMIFSSRRWLESHIVLSPLLHSGITNAFHGLLFCYKLRKDLE